MLSGTFVKNWHYRELRERIADGYTLRQFTTFYCQAVPKHHAFHRAFIRLTPKTLKAVNELVVQAAVKLGLEDGNRLRVDTTVVQSDIHHPTDNTLLWDVVRVVTRLVGRLREAVPQRIQAFSNRTRVARRRMQEIQRMTAKERQERQTKKYRELIGVTEEVVNCARKVVEQTSKARGKDMAICELRKEINHYCKLGDRVIHQESFGHAPQLYGSDRGFFSEQNVKSCKQDGVKVVCIPQCGGKRTAKREAYEKSPDFKKGQRFRAGIEGRISVLFRGRGMKRCLAEGRERFELWVGAAVLANNLMRIAALLSKRTRRKRKAA